MPDRYIPMSESEQQFARLLERIFMDEEFARSMDSDPEATLRAAGVELNEAQVAGIREARRFETPEELGDDQLGIPLTRPAVQILTKGTKPAVRVITKGTQPAVSVAVNTILVVEESNAPELEIVPEDQVISRTPPEEPGSASAGEG